LSDTNEYKPAAVETVDVEIPVAWLFAVTLAPGTIAPEGSVTSPLMLPRPAWANAALAAHRIRTQTKKAFCIFVALAFLFFMGGLSIISLY
jgi:hypothetical protein